MPDFTQTGRGFSLRATVPTPTAAASIIRAATVQASLSDFNLPSQPRSFPNQGPVNCCVSCALGGAMEVLHPDWPALAPLFHYHVSRVVNQQGDATGSLTLDEALSTLTNQGICQHSLHDVDQAAAYTQAEVEIRPSDAAFSDGATRKLPFDPATFTFKYKRLSGPSWIAAIRAELQNNRPVAVGFRLPEGYPKGFLNAQFEWTLASTTPLSLTGHCVVVTGYSDSRVALRVCDSQGTGIFDDGGWWMGYSRGDSGVIQDACSLIP